MKIIFFGLILCLLNSSLSAQADQVSVVTNDAGMKLVVNGKDFMINGMNWDYIPIGTNTVNANFWQKSDEVIKAGLDIEMSLLKNMNVNAIRQYSGVPAKWIRYIYENYGIYTMLNHSFGRYGLTLDGVWTPVTDYADPRTQKFLLSEVDDLVKDYKNTPGLLMYLLGNENNYGLFWAGAETEDFPDDEQEKNFIGEKRGRPMYRLMNEAAIKMKAIDSAHPVAICNGDVLFIDIVAEECKDIDIYGTNTYRGVSFGDMFQVVKDKLNKPIMFTEFGADAFNAIENAEDQKSQAYYMVGNWKEIYENAAGLGKADNSIGGFTFQFSDGWWKFGFDDRKNADIHDNNASWANGGYSIDLAPGENNMNEEWFGICAKGPTDERGIYDLYPRAAYYALKEAHELEPYAEGTTIQTIQDYFSEIQLMDAVQRAREDKAALESKKKINIRNFRAEFTRFNTGGSSLSTLADRDPDDLTYPNEPGFDQMQSYYVGIEENPAPNLRANIIFNIPGNVVENPLDEIFYENRARMRSVNTDEGNLSLTNLNGMQVYNAEFEWQVACEDNFEGHPGESINASNWIFELGRGPNGDGRGIDVLQIYADNPENVFLDGQGYLAITTISSGGYTSGRFITKGLFEKTYGRFDARIKLPWGPGIWPAFWLLGSNIESVGWPQCGEIEIMDLRGQEPKIVHGSLHGPGYSAGSSITRSFGFENERFDVDFHVFAIEWDENSIDYFVANVIYQRFKPGIAPREWVFDHPCYTLLNVSAGGHYVDFPSIKKSFPQTMLVDYV